MVWCVPPAPAHSHIYSSFINGKNFYFAKTIYINFTINFRPKRTECNYKRYLGRLHFSSKIGCWISFVYRQNLHIIRIYIYIFSYFTIPQLNVKISFKNQKKRPISRGLHLQKSLTDQMLQFILARNMGHPVCTCSSITSMAFINSGWEYRLYLSEYRW